MRALVTGASGLLDDLDDLDDLDKGHCFDTPVTTT